jgi:hypothetical protein
VFGRRWCLGLLLASSLAAAFVVAAPTAARLVARCAPAPPAPPATTVDDPALGVTWLANADLASTDTFNVSGISCDGSMEFATARRWVLAMNRADYLGHRDWTLPITPTPSTDSGCSGYNKNGGGHFGIGCTTSPLASLYTSFHFHAPDTAVAIPDATTGPFHDFQPYLYGTDKGHKPHHGNKTRCCFTFSFNTGRTSSNTDLFSLYVLPMIPGNAFHLVTVGGGSLHPVDGGQAVYQVVPGTSGITWLADADLSRTKTGRFGLKGGFGRDGSMTHDTAVPWIKEMSVHRWLGQTGWTWPTQNDLAGLYRALRLSGQEPVVPVPDTTLHGFQDIQPYLYWSCAGSSIIGSCSGVASAPPGGPPSAAFQWNFSFGNGFQGTTHVDGQMYAMVYYPNAPTAPPKPPKPPCKPAKPGAPRTCT